VRDRDAARGRVRVLLALCSALGADDRMVKRLLALPPGEALDAIAGMVS
jgi:hypothetical protein